MVFLLYRVASQEAVRTRMQALASCGRCPWWASGRDRRVSSLMLVERRHAGQVPSPWQGCPSFLHALFTSIKSADGHISTSPRASILDGSRRPYKQVERRLQAFAGLAHSTIKPTDNALAAHADQGWWPHCIVVVCAYSSTASRLSAIASPQAPRRTQLKASSWQCEASEVASLASQNPSLQ